MGKLLLQIKMYGYDFKDDFHAGLELIGDELRKEYAGRYDEVPNIVSYLPPVKGAVEAMYALQQSGKYDVYILSTSPWSNPTTWSDKVEMILISSINR